MSNYMLFNDARLQDTHRELVATLRWVFNCIPRLAAEYLAGTQFTASTSDYDSGVPVYEC